MFSLQVQYIHQLVQSRLFAEESPLVDLYKCLRILCFVVAHSYIVYKEIKAYRRGIHTVELLVSI